MSDGNEIVNNNTTSAIDAKHCKKCDRAGVEEGMVCCDVCDSWEHFLCAGVNESIAEPDRSWRCSECMADVDAVSKSGVSFNESSVSKSSRVSQKLQLSLQLLEEQRKLKKKRTEEEMRIRKLEEEAKLKEIDEEQDYLKQKYELLVQMEEEKDSSSRKSGISVKSRRERMEKWLIKEAQSDAVGRSKSSTSGQKITLLIPAVSQANVMPTTASTIGGNPNKVIPLNDGMLVTVGFIFI